VLLSFLEYMQASFFTVNIWCPFTVQTVEKCGTVLLHATHWMWKCCYIHTCQTLTCYHKSWCPSVQLYSWRCGEMEGFTCWLVAMVFVSLHKTFHIHYVKCTECNLWGP
jgi:hypothetical protein